PVRILRVAEHDRGENEHRQGSRRVLDVQVPIRHVTVEDDRGVFLVDREVLARVVRGADGGIGAERDSEPPESSGNRRNEYARLRQSSPTAPQTHRVPTVPRSDGPTRRFGRAAATYRARPLRPLGVCEWPTLRESIRVSVEARREKLRDPLL